MEYIELYKDRDYCLSEIRQARELFSSKYFQSKFDTLVKSLGLMLLYCPEDIYDIVLATLQEAEQRVAYY
jgi:hypothetical protein